MEPPLVYKPTQSSAPRQSASPNKSPCSIDPQFPTAAARTMTLKKTPYGRFSGLVVVCAISRASRAGPGLHRRKASARTLCSPSASVTRICFCRSCPSPARAALSFRVRVWAFSAMRGRAKNAHKPFDSQEKNIMANQKPVDEIRIGRVKATIWRNGTDEQPRHNVTFSRLYKEDDQWKSTQSFGRNDLLMLAKVADLAHTRIFQLPAEAELPAVQVDNAPVEPVKLPSPTPPGE